MWGPLMKVQLKGRVFDFAPGILPGILPGIIQSSGAPRIKVLSQANPMPVVKRSFIWPYLFNNHEIT